MTWTYRVVIACLVVALVYSVVATVNEYATGPAVIRITGQTQLTARTPGVVRSVEVRPGEKVPAGKILVRFDDVAELDLLEKVIKEFNLQLVKRLEDPLDPVAQQALASLRASRQLAEHNLEERLIRSPHAGTVSDIRIRAGEQLNAGDKVLSLFPQDARFRVVALVPGHYRPMIKPGSPLRLEVSGYKYTYHNFIVDTLGDEIIGPAEARRYLGQELQDSVVLPGPVVLVEASLPTNEFVAEGKSFNYYDGMQGTAEIPIRNRSVLMTLLPELKLLTSDSDG
jgi:membrane fusion protein (multidrug efflux system)